MRKILALLALLLLTTASAQAARLSEAESAALRADIEQMMHAFDAGNADTLIERTHPSLVALSGGDEAYAKLVRTSVETLRGAGIRFVSSKLGEPTEIHAAGDEEVCFVPRVSVMTMGDKTVRTTSFMIAIRAKGSANWKYLDGAGLRKNPQALELLLPKLEKNLQLPPNEMEEL